MSEAPPSVAAPLLLGPRGLERPTDAGYTMVGTLGTTPRSGLDGGVEGVINRSDDGNADGTASALVDRGGLVTPVGARWSLDWWIGADDRWYLPAREASVRQHRIGAGPVMETTMRIPSGTARQLVYGTLVWGREATVVEVHNDSPVPVALALALRPYPVLTNDTPSHKGADDLRLIGLEDRVVRVGTGVALVLPRPPSESGGSTTIDLLAEVKAGCDLRWDDSLLPGDAAQANGVFLYPLPHRTSLRCLVVGPATIERRVPAVAQAPDHESVARGWSAVVTRNTRFEFPDPGLDDAMDASRARQLLAAPTLGARLASCAPGAGTRLIALALGGYRSEVVAALDHVAEGTTGRIADSRSGAESMAAMGIASVVLNLSTPPELLESAMAMTAQVEKASRRRPGLRLRRSPNAGGSRAGGSRAGGSRAGGARTKGARAEGAAAEISDEGEPGAVARSGLAMLARQAGDNEGADQLTALPASDLFAQLGLAPSTTDELAAMLAEASGAGSWGDDDATMAARFVLRARSLLIDDGGNDLVLLPRFPLAWRGGSAEVHRAPTRHGLLSFAVRWHGARPALLWELDGSTENVPLRCPALDSDWVTDEPKGETLLAGSAEPLPAAPMPGESFS